MAIPSFESIMLPLLENLKDGEAHSFQSARDALSRYFELTDAELNQQLDGSDQNAFDERIRLAQSHLQKLICWKLRILTS